MDRMLLNASVFEYVSMLQNAYEYARMVLNAADKNVVKGTSSEMNVNEEKYTGIRSADYAQMRT